MLATIADGWFRWMCRARLTARWMLAREIEARSRRVNADVWRSVYSAGIAVIAAGMGVAGCMHTDTMQSAYNNSSTALPFGGAVGSTESKDISRFRWFDSVGIGRLDNLDYQKARRHRSENQEYTPVRLQGISQTWCNVEVEGNPAYIASGYIYRQGINARGRAPGVIRTSPSNVNVDQLLDQYLSNIATTPTGYRQSSRMRIEQPSLYLTNAHFAYSRGATGEGVRIAIDDSPVDILNWDLRGRITSDGAEFLFPQAYAFQIIPSAIAFRSCFTAEDAIANDCSVWEINAGGDEEVVNLYGRSIIEEFGYPDKENSWWIRDTSQSSWGAWYEIPALFDCNDYLWRRENIRTCTGYAHGTRVATVAAGWTYGVAPGADIVPLVGGPEDDPFDEFQNDEYFSSIGFWDQVRSGAISASERVRIAEGWVSSRAKQYSKFDIINRSYAWNISPLSSNAFVSEKAWSRYFPSYWREVQQLNTAADSRVIEVYSAGNYGLTQDPTLWGYPAGDGARPYLYPNFRGHHVAVMAVGADGIETDYTNRCGSLPSNWNSIRDGRHYCVAAPGDVWTIAPGWREEGVQSDYDSQRSGTSFAAPIVAGALALMMDYFTDANGNRQLGNREIALRLINTANNRGRYSNSAIYGAGLIDLGAATMPVGETSIGNGFVSAPARQTFAVLPTAIGDVRDRMRDITIATFDEWNAPFFVPAEKFFGVRKNNIGIRYRDMYDGARTQLAIDNLGLAEEQLGQNTPALKLIGGTNSIGTKWAARNWLDVGALLDAKSDQGAATSGALGSHIRSRLAWAQFNYVHDLSPDFSGWAMLSVGAGEADYQASMLDVGAATYSAWELGVKRGRTLLVIAQPWRAESGSGTLTYSTGRKMSGEHLFGVHPFSLEPSGREIAIQLRHGGQLAETNFDIQLSVHTDAGHTQGAVEGRATFSLRWHW